MFEGAKLVSRVSNLITELRKLSAFKCKICSFQQWKIRYDFFSNIQNRVLFIIAKHINSFLALEVNIELFPMYAKPETNDSHTKSFNTKNIILITVDDLEMVHNEFKLEISNKDENFQEKESGKCHGCISAFSFLNYLSPLI